MRTGNQDIIILFYSTVVELIPFLLQPCPRQAMSSFTPRIISSISSAIILVSIFRSQNFLGSHRLVTPYHICLIYLGQLKELNVCTAKKLNIWSNTYTLFWSLYIVFTNWDITRYSIDINKYCYQWKKIGIFGSWPE